MRSFYALLVICSSFVLMGGCSSNQVLFKVSELQKKQTVNLTLQTGEKVSGEIIAIDNETITVIDKNSKAWRANKFDISNVIGPIPVYDGNAKIVSEKEIARNMGSSNRKLFAFSGGLLSAGVSFFTSSMISRGAGDDSQDAITYGGTAVGTLLGSYMFFKAGSTKDRNKAIAKVSGSSEDPKVRAEKIKQAKVQAELDRLKNERAQQEKELKELQQKIKQKNP
jgi:hypothetical protein